MEARDAFRTSQLLEECQGAPEMFEQVIPRLYTFMKPFVKVFHGEAAVQHATISVCGLLSDVERKNIAPIAYRFGQSRLPLQGCIGWDEWDDAPLRDALKSQVKTHVGQGDGVLVSILLDFPRPVGSRWVWPGSGVVAWAKSITATWPSTWGTSPARGTR